MQLIATDNRQVVIGLGMTGLSCARYLAAKKKSFSVVDSRQQPPGLEDFKREFPNINISLGGISEQSLQGADQLVVSPGVALEEPAIAKAIKNGIVVCGDIDLFRDEANAPIIAITGSNGKSTVTTLVGEMAKEAGKNVAVGGNIGIPALELLAEPEPDLYVLELSSFQLERSQYLAAEVATVLNVSADHMDRYDSLQSYHHAKHQIFKGCKKVVLNRADALSRPLMPDVVKVISFGLDNTDFNGFGLIDDSGNEYLSYQFKALMPVSELKMAGRHNIENALAALALGTAVDLNMDVMLSVLRSFTGLDHRCQFVAEHGGVRYYNDSKGTNVGACIAAINGLADDAEKIILIAGGVAKAADFKPLLPVLKQHVRSIMLIGEAADELEKLCIDVIPLKKLNSIQQAVEQAFVDSQPGDAVLLSPACASFDMFKNYQQRGDTYSHAVVDVISARKH